MAVKVDLLLKCIDCMGHNTLKVCVLQNCTILCDVFLILYRVGFTEECTVHFWETQCVMLITETVK